VRHVVTHELDLPTARRVADAAFDSYRKRFSVYHPELEWQTPLRARASFSALGVHAHGTVELAAGAIAFELEVPWPFRIFVGRAVSVVEREVRLWVEAARRGEL
jgi:hypothetical protein